MPTSHPKPSTRFLIPAVLLAMLVAVLIFQYATQSSSTTVSGDNLTANAAWEMVQERKLTIVDIRRAEEWQQTGTPQDAIRLSFETHPQGPEGFLRDLEAALESDKTRPFAIICRTGNRTGLLLPFLHANGFTKAQAIPEGMTGSSHGRGWLRHGLPVDR
ncbi:rhodanese-like domain-containing protein [Desulfonatronum thiodismutans]|uniref:rhodanese-like domain-containing protein n=1 Tax=Desulfonatronum thiodismutans TaxID=159290 RepID=UPI00068A5402|nr:rhodanese-like domain-containing protein [Desulfonatronum thiodismutans]